MTPAGPLAPFRTWRSTVVAPSTRSVRSVVLPIFDILPRRSLPPLEWGFGVSPIHAAKCRAEVKPAMSGTSALIAAAVIGPMPGTAVRRRISSSRRTCSTISFSKASISWLKASICSARTGQRCTSSAGQPRIGLIANDHDEFARSGDTLSRHGPQLAEVTAQGVDGHGPLAHQEIPRYKKHGVGLTLCRFDRHKAHCRPRYRLADRFGIGRVGLAALDIGLHIGWRNQPDLVAKRSDLARPVMGPAASLEADEARLQLAEPRQNFGAPKLPLHCDGYIGADAMDLKHRLRATARLISFRCSFMALVSQLGRTRPAPLPFFGQVAPKMQAHMVH